MKTKNEAGEVYHKAVEEELKFFHKRARPINIVSQQGGQCPSLCSDSHELPPAPQPLPPRQSTHVRPKNLTGGQHLSLQRHLPQLFFQLHGLLEVTAPFLIGYHNPNMDGGPERQRT